MNWYLTVLKRYALFNGRARRKEYWMFFLINALISITLSFIEGMLIGTGFTSIIYGLLVLIPSLAVAVRRLHDINRTGWWMFILFIPIIGIIVLIVFSVTEGTVGKNPYGTDPKIT